MKPSVSISVNNDTDVDKHVSVTVDKSDSVLAEVQCAETDVTASVSAAVDDTDGDKMFFWYMYS